MNETFGTIIEAQSPGAQRKAESGNHSHASPASRRCSSNLSEETSVGEYIDLLATRRGKLDLRNDCKRIQHIVLQETGLSDGKDLASILSVLFKLTLDLVRVFGQTSKTAYGNATTALSLIISLNKLLAVSIYDQFCGWFSITGQLVSTGFVITLVLTQGFLSRPLEFTGLIGLWLWKIVGRLLGQAGVAVLPISLG